MNAVAVIYVNQHLESIANDRRASVAEGSKRSLRERLASIAGTIRSAKAGPIVAPAR